MTAEQVSARRDRWERLAPLGALGFLGTVVLGAAAIGETSPSSEAPAAEIARYFVEHRGGVILNSVLVVLGGFAMFPLFLAALWQAIRREEGDGGLWSVVVPMAGVAMLAPLLIQAVGWGAAALHAGEHRDPWVAAALLDLGDMGFLLLPIPAGLLVAATTAAAGQGVLFPRWLVRAGAGLAVVLLVGAVIATALAPVYFVLFGLWLLAVAAVLFRAGGRP